MAVRILGLDPGLRHTGWGMIEADGHRLRSLADGVVHTDAGDALAVRLACLFEGLRRIMTQWSPHEAAVEETFVNRNPLSTLKLGQARGFRFLYRLVPGFQWPSMLLDRSKKRSLGPGSLERAGSDYGSYATSRVSDRNT